MHPEQNRCVVYQLNCVDWKALNVTQTEFSALTEVRKSSLIHLHRVHRECDTVYVES